MQRRLVPLVLLACASSADTWAQNNGGNPSELRITVTPAARVPSYTAPGVGDALQREPVAATVFSDADLRDSDAQDMAAIASATPGMNFTSVNGNARTTNLVLRGAGSQSIFGSAERPVGVFLDDVFLPNPSAYGLNFYDIDRVEVLRGPQGTRGGKNVLAGAVRLETARPSEQFGGLADLGYGTYDNRHAFAAVTGGLVPGKVTARFSAGYADRDGFDQNTLGGDRINTRKDYGATGRVLIQADSDTLIDLSTDVSRFLPYAIAGGGFDQVLDHRVTQLDPFQDNRTVYGGSMRATHRADDVTLKSITAVRGYNYFARGSDPGPNDLYRQSISDEQMQYSQEIRLSSPGHQRLRWVAGGLLFAEQFDTTGYQQLNNLASLVGVARGHRDTTQSEQLSVSSALFGEVTYGLTSRLDLIAGLRATHDRKWIDYRQGSNDGVTAIGFAQEKTDESDYTNLSPRVGLSYSASRDATVYGLVSRGYKSGGYNVLVSSTPDLAFGQETATSYEVGVKSTWLDNRLLANASAYWVDWNNQQVEVFSAFGTQTINADSSRTRGAELELAASPLRGLGLTAGLGLADARFTSFTNYAVPTLGAPAALADVSGNRIPYSSRFTANLTAEYRHEIEPDALSAVFRAEYAYRSSIVFDPQNRFRQDGYSLVNVRLGIETTDWGFYLWGKNLTDAAYRVSALDGGPNGILAIAGDPRTLGVQVRARF